MVTSDIGEFFEKVRRLPAGTPLKIDKIAHLITMQAANMKLETTEKELLEYKESLPNNLLFDYPKGT